MNKMFILLGAKRSKGVIDSNGKAYDSTKLYVQTALEQNGNAVGYGVTEYNWGSSENFSKISNLNFPCYVELTFDLVSNGKTTKMVVLDVVPVADGKQVEKAK